MYQTSSELSAFFIQQVKEKVDIVEVISSKLDLKKQGKDYLGLCPFHDEKTPSFSVSAAKQMYYCFGCQAGGDAIKFLVEFDKKSFRDVVLELAQRYSVPQVDGGQQEQKSKVVNIKSKPKAQKAPIPIPPAIKLCELPDDREPSPQPAGVDRLNKPKQAGENSHSFEELTYRYSDDQWVSRIQWKDPDHPKGRNKTYCQWHRHNGKAIAKKGEKVWPAYRVEEVISALSGAENGNAIIWVEGEPNVESLRALGLASITLMGSGWQPDVIEDALLSIAFENGAPIIIDLIESDKPGLLKKDKLQSVCAERAIPYVRLSPCDLWGEKPVEVPTESADVTDVINAIGAAEFQHRLNEKLSALTAKADKDESENSQEEEEEEQNKIYSKLNRKRIWIEKGLGHRLTYNDFKKRIELDDEPINDDLDDQGGAKLFIAEQLDIDISDTDALAILNRTAKKRRYHPVRDYLEKCYAKYKDTEILNGIALRYFGTTEPLHQSYVIKHLIGSVKRVFEPGSKHDTMLILKSEEGAKKSTFFRELYGEQNFTDSVLGTEEKDSLMTLNLYWCCEYGEFETITSRKAVSELKAFLARARDDYRAPYAKTVRSHPRTFVLVGSTNRDDFIQNDTGSRRLMVIPVMSKIPVEKLVEERDRIWGAAVALYRAGVASFLDDEERKLQREVNDDYSQIDPWKEIITSFLSDLNPGTFVSSRTILEKALNIEPKQMDIQSSRRVGGILTGLGWTKKTKRRENGLPQNGWIVPSQTDSGDLGVPDKNLVITQYLERAEERISQGFQPTVPDDPDKNQEQFFSHLEHLSPDPQTEKFQLKNDVEHLEQEPETLARYVPDAVPDVVITKEESSGTANNFEIGDRVKIIWPESRFFGCWATVTSVNGRVSVRPDDGSAGQKSFRPDWSVEYDACNLEPEPRQLSFDDVPVFDSGKSEEVEICDREINIEGKMALSLWQPWANLLTPNPSTGLIYKTFETRNWETDYRGELVIHAGKEKNSDLEQFSNQLAEKLGIAIDFDNLPRGCAIAVCDLVDCVEMTEEFIGQQSETEIACGVWEPGRFAWKLENVRLLPSPISVRGYQKLWRVKLNPVGTGISGRELAKRLGVSPSMISEKRDRGFTAWSKGKDPGGKGWVFDAGKKLFFPQ